MIILSDELTYDKNLFELNLHFTIMIFNYQTRYEVLIGSFLLTGRMN